MLRRPVPSASRAAAASLAALALILGLAACGPQGSPQPSETSRAEPTASPAPEPPTYHPDGTAEDNLPLFTEITAQVWSTDQRGSGRAYIDALVAAGFDRAAMQVTADQTTVGNPAESLQFSVRWGDAECLIGQVGPSTGGPVTAVMPQLAEGRCLVGNTRPIDW